MITWQLKHFNQLTTTELYTLLQLRSEVFVVEQTCPYLDPDGKDLYCHHLMGYVGNDLAVYSRLVPAGVSYAEVSIGRVISSPKYRGQQLGKQLMEKSVEAISELYGSAPIRIGAQAYLKQFYEGFGFVDLNQPYLEDGIPHIIMLRKA